MDELARLRHRPGFLAIAIGCINGLIWAAYYAIVKQAGPLETVLVFLGGIPPVALIAWTIIGQVQARAALQRELRTAGKPVEVSSPSRTAARISVGCIAPFLSFFSGLIAGIGLLTSGVYRQWIHPDQIAVLLLIPAAALGVGLLTMRSQTVGRRAALFAIAGALGSAAIAGLMGIAGYLMYPWFAGTLT
jgi:hypothetical protein